MVEFATLTNLEISLGVVALLAVILAIICAVRCAVARRRRGGGAKEVITDGSAEREGLLNKEEVVVAVDDGDDDAEPGRREGERDEPLCAICKAPLADGGLCRLLRVCGHVYHAECIDLWLERRTLCPLCRAGVVVSRTDIVDVMA